jgi:FkbM family methyltransferase
MSFISYAQNNEDVLLWRALGDVPPAAGFYIDVGASDPVEHSVTKSFYDAGWRGINIEPLPAHIAAFAEQRPRDVNLAVAAGSRTGSLTLYDVPAVRGWASPDPAVAARHRAAGHAVAELTVPVRTLAAICAEHVRGPVHFLKIDVEGFEREVLRGMDFARWRPWVLVIEATLPNSRVTTHDSWEALVTLHGYRFAWFDGLNRYYVADEHAALLRHFGVQPNVFDDYISYHLERAWDATRRTEQALQASDAGLQAAQRRLDEAARHADALEHEQRAAQADAAGARAESAQAQRGAIDAQAGTLRAQADAIQARTALAEARADTVRAQAATIQAQADVVQAQADALQARAEAAQARTAATQASADAAAARTGAAEAAAALARALTDAAAARCDTAQAQAHAAAERDQAARARAELARAHAGIAVTQAAAQAEIARMHGEYEQAVANGRQVAAWAHDLEQRLLATLDSPSWKLTQPLRALGTWLQRLRGPGLARPGLARRTLQCVSADERMRRVLIPVLLRYPALGRRVSGVLRRVRQDAPAAAPAALVVPEDLRHLPASVRTVLADLRRVRGRQQQQQQQQQEQPQQQQPHEQQQPAPLQQAPLQQAQAPQAGQQCAS